MPEPEGSWSRRVAAEQAESRNTSIELEALVDDCVTYGIIDAMSVCPGFSGSQVNGLSHIVASSCGPVVDGTILVR